MSTIILELGTLMAQGQKLKLGKGTESQSSKSHCRSTLVPFRPNSIQHINPVFAK